MGETPAWWSQNQAGAGATQDACFHVHSSYYRAAGALNERTLVQHTRTTRQHQNG